MKDTDTSRRSLLLGLSTLPAIAVLSDAALASDMSDASAASSALGRPVNAGGAVVTPTVQAPRGKRGIFTRLPDLDIESYQSYVWGRARWSGQLRDVADQRGQEILRLNGIDPTKPTDMKVKELAELLHDDPIIARAARLGSLNNYDTFATLRNYFHSKGSHFLELMEAADKQGPGALVMSPDMDIPDYTKHEIHNQTGGYQGDPFAGWTYFYGTQILGDGAGEQDAFFDAIAKSIPAPPDGKVRRILDQGTGTGQLATAMKRRFPDAEVWGLDVAGPMVRFAHLRANQMGMNVNFAHRLAEDNGFPDNHFDIITSSSFHHEMTAEASKNVFKEVQRVLRPGGVYRPADSGMNGYEEDALGKLDHYLDYRITHEVWMMEWGDMDRLGAMRAAGLKVDPNAIPGVSGGSWWLDKIRLVATKA
ncbi:class I SAM-dependent methyltransferase [Povalibacter sp.]|uniref:class I SAM-dependent methyltransferase n=1 Tax=Povalibacter sp. TaxID=1962978 RepID=UPI002F41893B